MDDGASAPDSEMDGGIDAQANHDFEIEQQFTQYRGQTDSFGHIVPIIFGGVATAQFLIACFILVWLIYCIVRDYIDLQRRLALRHGDVVGFEDTAQHDEDVDAYPEAVPDGRETVARRRVHRFQQPPSIPGPPPNPLFVTRTPPTSPTPPDNSPSTPVDAGFQQCNVGVNTDSSSPGGQSSSSSNASGAAAATAFATPAIAWPVDGSGRRPTETKMQDASKMKKTRSSRKQVSTKANVNEENDAGAFNMAANALPVETGSEKLDDSSVPLLSADSGSANAGLASRDIFLRVTYRCDDKTPNDVTACNESTEDVEPEAVTRVYVIRQQQATSSNQALFSRVGTDHSTVFPVSNEDVITATGTSGSAEHVIGAIAVSLDVVEDQPQLTVSVTGPRTVEMMPAAPSVDADFIDHRTASASLPVASTNRMRDVKRSYADVISEVRNRHQVGRLASRADQNACSESTAVDNGTQLVDDLDGQTTAALASTASDTAHSDVETDKKTK